MIYNQKATFFILIVALLALVALQGAAQDAPKAPRAVETAAQVLTELGPPASSPFPKQIDESSAKSSVAPTPVAESEPVKQSPVADVPSSDTASFEPIRPRAQSLDGFPSTSSTGSEAALDTLSDRSQGSLKHSDTVDSNVDPDALYDYAEDVVATVGGGVPTGNRDVLPDPLKIESADLKPGVVGTPYSDTVRISGGIAPYQFTAAGLPADFTVDSATGVISGTAKTSSENKLIVSVTDATRVSRRRAMDLVIRTTPIFISSSSIGQATTGEPFLSRLTAQGGKPPYIWSISAGGLAAGLSLTGEGSVTGVPTEEFAGVVRVMVQDDEKAVDQADLPLKVVAAAAPAAQPSESETSSAPVDIAPGEAKQSENEADTSSTLPSSSSDSNSSGGAAASRSKVKLFVAAPSSEKAGLAWQLAAGVSISITRSTEAFPAAPTDGEQACGGVFTSRTNCVDSGLENGRSYYYSAFAIGADGKADDEKPLQALVIPNAVSLAGPVDPFVDEVVEFRPLDKTGCFNCNRVNQAVVGPPQGKGEKEGSFDVVALGAKVNSDSGASAPYGGSITVRFNNNIVVNGSGVDFTVFENPIRLGDTDTYFVEPAVVEVSADGVNFFRFPIDFVPHYDAAGKLNLGNPLCYAKGFAGIKSVYSFLGVPNPTNPNLSGGDQFDLDDLTGVNLSWIQYVRIIATGDGWLTDENGDPVRHSNEPPTYGASGKGNSGFDFDAIAAVHY